MIIEYIFEIEKSRTLFFQVDINRQYTEEENAKDYQFWTELKYHKCENCPLSSEVYRYCPAAKDLQEIIKDFSSLISYNEATVIVKTQDREYRKKCDVQTGLQSVLGLIMATSACPILSKLSMLAHFHLPFATTDDTLFRAVGAYLIQQYFTLSDGEEPDFKLAQLKLLYSELEQLNISFSERIRIASEKDANLGAIVQLGALSFMVRASLEQQLKDFRENFQEKFFGENAFTHRLS